MGYGRKSQKQLENEGKIYTFLKNNPLSTAEEIFKATGCGGLIGLKYIKGKKYNNQWVWRLNYLKMKDDGLL